MALALLAVAFAGCRGASGGDEKKPDDASTQGPAVDGLVTKPAKELIPDLTSDGYKLADEFSQPVGAPGQDNFRRAYVKTDGSNRVVLVDVTVHPSVDQAKQAYTQVAEAWRNPPPGVFTGIEKFDETPSPKVGDEQRSYVSGTGDSKGNKAWTDVYRAENLVIVIQTLDNGDTDQMRHRTEVVEGVLAEAN